jgi:hypothetical protein
MCVTEDEGRGGGKRGGERERRENERGGRSSLGVRADGDDRRPTIADAATRTKRGPPPQNNSTPKTHSRATITVDEATADQIGGGQRSGQRGGVLSQDDDEELKTMERLEEARRALEHVQYLMTQAAAGGPSSAARASEAIDLLLDVMRRIGAPAADIDRLVALGAAVAATAAASPAPAAPETSFGPADLAQLLEQVSLVAHAPPPPAPPPSPPPADGTHGAASVLAESGRASVADDAVADGSSVRCGACGGVIAARRVAQHAAWCSGGGAGGGGAGGEDMED